MKKTICIIAAASLLIPSFVFAAAFTSSPGAAITGTKTGGSPQPLGQLSNNVTLKANYTNAAYAAATKHLNGTKEFGSSNGDTKIFSKELAAGTAAPTDLSASDSSAFATGWTAL